jgi:outer membrane protein OmpA-like peptidoglycan-associated protein
MDETLLTQGEINRVLEQMEAGEMPPILFEAGLPTLLTTSYEALDNMGAVLRRHPTMKVRVYGFAEEDFVGGPVRANALALARSEAVRQYLIQNFRLADTNLVSAGIPPLPPVLEGQAPPTPPRRISFEVVP